LADISPDIKSLQLEQGQRNIETWQIKAESENKQREKEENVKSLIEKSLRNEKE
jgi:hypothetical protein